MPFQVNDNSWSLVLRSMSEEDKAANREWAKTGSKMVTQTTSSLSPLHAAALSLLRE